MSERILFVDDDPPVRRAFARTLSNDGLEVDTAEGAQAAMALADQSSYAVIATDFSMPGLNGLELIHDLQQVQPHATYMLVSGACDLGLALEAINEHHVEFVITKPWDTDELSSMLRRGIEGYWERATQAALQRSMVSATRTLDSQRQRIQQALSQAELVIAEALLGALDLRHHETRAHCRRVAEYARVLGEAMGVEGSELATLAVGALLHDIGKIGVPDRILLKPGPLDEAEWVVMREHCVMGARLLDGIEVLRGAREIVLQHHERWDGKGYPGGIAAGAIHAGARIFAVADALDAMLSRRPYKQPLPLGEAIGRVLEAAGSQFDPAVVRALAVTPPSRWMEVREAHRDP